MGLVYSVPSEKVLLFIRSLTKIWSLHPVEAGNVLSTLRAMDFFKQKGLHKDLKNRFLWRACKIK